MNKPDTKLDSQDDRWDDTLLIKAYDDSVKLAREELARRIAISTSKDANASNSSNESNILSSNDIKIVKTKHEYHIGDYVRATYEDGKDYEAIILKIDPEAETCLLKYIGYENDQNIPLYNLIPSWGKKARRHQFANAKLEESDQIVKDDKTKTSSKTTKRNKLHDFKTIPPPPPMPPMLSAAAQNCEDSEHLSAMLMSWYMSGYYTGVYQGMQMAKSKSSSKNKKK